MRANTFCVGQPIFSIRPALTDDAPAILACLRAAFDEYRASYTPAAFLDTVLTQETVERRLSEMFVLVATDGSNQIVGTIACAVLKREEGHLRGMAVLPSWLGTGVAKNLLQQAELQLAQAHCKRISLDTTQPLKRAIQFYLQNGYLPSGKVTDFFGMPLFEYVKILGR